MCGFNDDWACPTHLRADGRMLTCPPGGCSKDCCARDRADEIELLTGSRPALADVHHS